MKVIFVSVYLEIECRLISIIMNYSLNLDFLFLFFAEYFIKSNIFLILFLYSTRIIDFFLTKPIGIIKMRSSSPVLRGSYRIDSSLKPIKSIVQRQNLLSKIVTNHLYYKCRMSHFLTTKFQLYSSYIILYFPMPKLVFIPDPENSPNFNKK